MNLLTAEEVAAILKCSPRWVYDHREELGGFKISGLVRFEERRIYGRIQSGQARPEIPVEVRNPTERKAAHKVGV